MDGLDIIFNVILIGFQSGTIITVIFVILEFRRSNEIRKLQKYIDIFNSIQNNIDELIKREVKKLEQDDLLNEIHDCLKFLLRIKYNLKLKDLSKLNEFISQILESFFNFCSNIESKKLKIFKKELMEFEGFLLSN